MITWSKAYSRSEQEPWEPYLSKCVNTCFCWSSTRSTEFNTDCILKAHFVQDYYCYCYLAFAEMSPAEAHLAGACAWPLWSQRHQTSPTSRESLHWYSVRWLCSSPGENNDCKKKRSFTQNWSPAAGKVLDFGLGTRLHCIRWLLCAAESQGKSCV